MINSKQKLRITLAVEYAQYFPSKKSFIRSMLLRERFFYVWRYQKALRCLEYYKIKKAGGGWLSKLLFAFYSRKVNKLGMDLGVDTWCNVFDEGLLIHHVAGGIVVNSQSRIGKNCHLHGNNCIGNNGLPDGGSPVIGDNCMIGVGSKIVGNIQLGNNIKIAAGAVVVKSCLQDGVTLAGVPARIIK